MSTDDHCRHTDLSALRIRSHEDVRRNRNTSMLSTVNNILLLSDNRLRLEVSLKTFVEFNSRIAYQRYSFFLPLCGTSLNFFGDD